MPNGKWMNRETVKIRTVGNDIEVYVPEHADSWIVGGPSRGRFLEAGRDGWSFVAVKSSRKRKPWRAGMSSSEARARGVCSGTPLKPCSR